MTRPEQGTTFFYLRKPDRTPVGVIAMRRPSCGHTLVLVSASLCAPTDQWIRSRGVNAALGRLSSDEHRYAVALQDIDNFNKVLRYLIPEHPDHGWAVERAGVDLAAGEKLYKKQLRYLLEPKPQ